MKKVVTGSAALVVASYYIYEIGKDNGDDLIRSIGEIFAIVLFAIAILTFIIYIARSLDKFQRPFLGFVAYWLSLPLIGDITSILPQHVTAYGYGVVSLILALMGSAFGFHLLFNQETKPKSHSDLENESKSELVSNSRFALAIGIFIISTFCLFAGLKFTGLAAKWFGGSLPCIM